MSAEGTRYRPFQTIPRGLFFAVSAATRQLLIFFAVCAANFFGLGYRCHRSEIGRCRCSRFFWVPAAISAFPPKVVLEKPFGWMIAVTHVEKVAEVDNCRALHENYLLPSNFCRCLWPITLCSGKLHCRSKPAPGWSRVADRALHWEMTRPHFASTEWDPGRQSRNALGDHTAAQSQHRVDPGGRLCSGHALNEVADTMQTNDIT